MGMVLAHVIGLWVTSPPDIIDALLFRAPTAFSYPGVIAMWAIFLSGALMMMRRRLSVHPITLRKVHRGLALVIVATTIGHAVLIEGTMGWLSKWGLCMLTAVALGKVLFDIHRKRKT